MGTAESIVLIICITLVVLAAIGVYGSRKN